jgi:hypothetical protein
MVRIRVVLLISFFILASCNYTKKIDFKDKEIKKYIINYSIRNQGVNIVIFDNNDTIYFSNKPIAFKQYIKIESDEETINEIKDEIINHLHYKSLLVERDFFLHKGYLNLSVSCGEKEFKLQQSGVNNDLRVSKRFYNMIENLKKKHIEIRALF